MASIKSQQPRLESNLRQISVLTGRRNDLIFRGATTARTLSPAMITTRGVDTPPIAFTFPYPPQQIQYSNMSPELSEISRPGKVPIIAFNRYRAKQIAFKFLLAVPLDGLAISIDRDIEVLQEIANTGRPVYFTNLDRQISNPLNISNELRIFWSIIDLTFSSIRRNERNQIVAAEADITLMENNNPKIKVADLPRITYTENVPTSNKPKDSDPQDDHRCYTCGSYRTKVTGKTD